MPFNSKAIALWLACVLMALPLQATEQPGGDVPTLEVAGSSDGLAANEIE